MAGRDFGSIVVKNFVKLVETSGGGGGDYIALTAPSSLSSSYQITLPSNIGVSGQFLQTDGTDTAVWANVSSSAISHTGLSNIDGGTYRDGGHAYLTQSHLGSNVPTINDDITAYKVNTVWMYGNETYVCTANSLGAAVWHKLLYSEGILVAAIGSVSNPSIYLSTDTTSGLYRIGLNNIGVAISGSKVLDIASTGLGVTGTISASSGGTVGLPAIYLNTDTTSGLYRIGLNNIGMSISGSKVLDVSSTGLSVIGQVSNTSGTNYGFIGGDGTVSLPAFRFVNSSNCGLYRKGANNIGFAINGADLLDLNTVGLGVGQAAAAEKLEVNGNIKSTGLISQSARMTPTTITAVGPTALSNTYGLVLCDCTTNNVSVRLPILNTYPGIVYKIVKIDAGSNTVTIMTNGFDTIDGQSSLILTTKSMVELTDCTSFWNS